MVPAERKATVGGFGVYTCSWQGWGWWASTIALLDVGLDCGGQDCVPLTLGFHHLSPTSGPWSSKTALLGPSAQGSARRPALPIEATVRRLENQGKTLFVFRSGAVAPDTRWTKSYP